MSEEKRYIDSIFADEKYLRELRTIYDEMKSVRRFKRRLDEIDNEVTWYVGNEKNMFLPDYMGFYNYAYEHYIPKIDDTIVHSKYKELLGEYRSSDIPGCLYCLVLLGHLHDEEESFLKQHEKDFESLSKSTISDFIKLHCKTKLLYGFLGKINDWVAIFINSIDMAETEHLDDDIKTLGAVDIKHRFMHALQLRDKSMSFKLLGRMRELDEGEDYYFEALAHYINEEYDEAIRYIEKVERTNIDYQSAVALELECYSLMGDISGFMKCINANKQLIFNYWHFEYMLMSLVLRIDENAVLELPEENIIENIKFDDSNDTYYMDLLFCLVADIIVEGLCIIEESEVMIESVEGLKLSEKKMHRFEQLQTAIAIFPDDIKKYLDFEYIGGTSVSEIKKEAELDLLELLIDKNPMQSFDKIKKAFLCQLNLGDTKGFLDNVGNNFDALVKYSEAGESGADELLRIAYIEGMVIGNLDEKIEERVEDDRAIDLTQNISDKKIYNFLSEQGKLAYEAAEWQYIKSQEEDYGWKDAGMISLSFYRILEVELNKKFIIPLLSKIGYDSLHNEYLNCVSTFTGDDRQQYRRKWGTILKTYKGMEEGGFAGNGFMLGVLDFFFRAIGSGYDQVDSLGILIRDKLGEVLNSYGLEKFNEGFFETITNDDTRNKYRNLPAHTRYLPYETACECREVFRKTILQLSDMLK